MDRFSWLQLHLSTGEAQMDKSLNTHLHFTPCFQHKRAPCRWFITIHICLKCISPGFSQRMFFHNHPHFCLLRPQNSFVSSKNFGVTCHLPYSSLGFPSDSVAKNPPVNAGHAGSIPGLGRSPGEGNGFPLQYSHLGSPMDIGVWWATVNGITKSWTRLNH